MKMLKKILMLPFLVIGFILISLYSAFENVTETELN